MDKYAKSS